MSVKHTPGPWTIRYSYPAHRPDSLICRATCGAGEPLRLVRDNGDHEMSVGRFEQMLGADGTVVFGVGQDYDDPGDGPNEANAAVIEAAPDMLAKLHKLAAWLDRLAERSDEQARTDFASLAEACRADAKNWRATAADIRKVIRRAEGREE